MISCDKGKVTLKGNHVMIMSEFQTLMYSMLETGAFKEDEALDATAFVLANWKDLKKMEKAPKEEWDRKFMDILLKDLLK